ncbi:MAG: hypothetical protein EOM10_00285 [Opitutae bacterium]|nr:hypothetical protein [Opitutae bacterium]
MTTQDMINTIRAGKRLGHRALAEIADRLEEQDAYLRSALATLQEQAQLVTEQEEQLREMGRAFSDARQRVVRMGVNEQELLARCDALELEVVTLQETLSGAADVMRQAMTMMATAPRQ